MTDEQEIPAEVTAEELERYACMRCGPSQRPIATTYRRAARTIERLEREVTALHAGMREQEPHAEVGRLVEQVVELSQQIPYLIYYDAEGNMRRVALAAADLHTLVTDLEAARQPEPVPAPSGELYRYRDGVLEQFVGGVVADWCPAHAIPTVDLDHVHALMHGGAE